MSYIRNILNSLIIFPQSKEAREQLKRLRVRDVLNQSTPDDLREWESNLKILNNSKLIFETTKMLHEKLNDAFLLYLKKHYPVDERLVKLQNIKLY
ncbi:hypothetical protein M2444_005607 [Paenibacillus sp. PastF-3]|uniref:hypothetical protein n=1 Tax=unclassified Paenibacillus TaxID=185978 RepID=UPI002473ACBA|nr:hypothetical protein [Paenibacillus sp. PastF-3]MDH6373764.1 hypothetical protein [Paenibacillus sp. PastF-3]